MFNEKLNRRENEVMSAVFSLSSGKERFLVSLYELLSALPAKSKYDEDKLERVLRSLELDGYFEFVLTERKGEKTYVVHMREAGLAFRRSDAQRRRTLLIRFGLTVLCGFLSALVGVVIKRLLS